MKTVLERLSRALETGRPSKMLDFGEFRLLKLIGGGQQGFVAQAKNRNNKHFAIKFYQPTDTSPRMLKRGKERFIREAEILLSLKHHNVANLYVAGSARWDPTRNMWGTSARFDYPGQVLYYVMDKIEGKSVKKLFYRKKKDYEVDQGKCTKENQRLFEELIVQGSEAMHFFHKKGVTHRDIKPENIIYSQQDSTFVIVDFGFARKAHTSSNSTHREYVPNRRYLDWESEQVGLLDARCDQYMFAKMLEELLNLFAPFYPEQDLKGMRAVLAKASSRRTTRFDDMRSFVRALEPYLRARPQHRHGFELGAFLVPEQGFGYLDSTVRIPFSGSIPLCRNVRAIIDTHDFQRLRSVSQLGPTHFVYPGATHSRFEHSLGTYGLCLKYLQTLLSHSAFRQAIAPVDEGVKVILLASLLHDLGHYPYSHWIEELDSLPTTLQITRHEDRASHIIENSEIGPIIRNQWDVSPGKVARVIARTGISQQEKVLSSLVDSVIDLDKIDYLQRDSAHCGVPYGEGFDVQRLIAALCLNEHNNAICLTEKGRSSFAAFLMSKIVMYQEVYWHKTVRACTAMFKRFFYEFVTQHLDRADTIRKIYLTQGDVRFIDMLDTKSRHLPSLNRLIRPFAALYRAIYKPAYVHYHGHVVHLTDTPTRDFFEILMESTYEKAVRMTHDLVEELRPAIRGLGMMDVILERTPVGSAEKPDLKGFQFLDTVLGKYEGVTKEIEGLNDYLWTQTEDRTYFAAPPSTKG